MSDDKLTSEEIEQAGELASSLMPLAGLLVHAISDKDADLIGRSVRQLADEESRMNAESAVFMAMGFNPEYEPAIRNARRNGPILKKMLELRQMVLRAQREEAVEAERDEQRNAFRRQLGL